MDVLKIAKTINTPSVTFDPTKKVFRLEGRSIPEDPGVFYNALIDWLKQFLENNNGATPVKLEIQLEYINSGSSKFLLGIAKVLDKGHKSGQNNSIYWYYEEDDESVLDLGRHIKTSVELPMKLVEWMV